jgi:hypothetical protein
MRRLLGLHQADRGVCLSIGKTGREGSRRKTGCETERPHVQQTAFARVQRLL